MQTQYLHNQLLDTYLDLQEFLSYLPNGKEILTAFEAWQEIGNPTISNDEYHVLDDLIKMADSMRYNSNKVLHCKITERGKKLF